MVLHQSFMTGVVNTVGDVTHKKSTHPNHNIYFRVQTRRLAKSFEPLNSSPLLSVPELCSRKAKCDLFCWQEILGHYWMRQS